MRIAIATVALCIAAISYYVFKTNDTTAELDKRWSSYSESSQVQIDYSSWQLILDDYLISDTDSGVHLFDYGGLLDDDRQVLDDAVNQLTAIDPLTLNQHEQKAFWINLYNILTVQLILNNYPVASITNLGSNPVEFGPWNEVATQINGIDLSLNDIEHRIIRPLYNDYRIHFAVNCASIGCPNLHPQAFTAEQLNEQLDAAASDYLNHPRGIRFDGETLQLSTLFEWYASDFGESQTEVLNTLGQHTGTDMQNRLAKFSGKPTYDYDWGLNGYCSIDNECE